MYVYICILNHNFEQSIWLLTAVIFGAWTLKFEQCSIQRSENSIISVFQIII